MTQDTYLRVTEVLYPFSGLQNIDKNVLERAAKRGTRVHKICESIIEGLGEWGVDDEVRGYVESFKKWWSTAHKVVVMEKRFFCDELGITGQVDLIIESPSGLSIVDLKTPAQPSKTWPLQGSAYAYMARKAGYDIKHIQFLQLSKYGDEPTLHEYEDHFELFQKCLDVFNHFFRRKTRGIADHFEV